MKRRDFLFQTTAVAVGLAGARARAATPCPPPTLSVDSQPPVQTACEPLPSWVPAPGQWAAVGQNTLASVQGPAPNSGSPFASSNGFHKIWAGGTYAPGYGGTYGSIIYGPNGGHASYDGSDVYAYDIETRRCSLVKATYNPTSSGCSSSGDFPDMSPCPPHGYDGHVVLPHLGGKGTLVVPQTYASLTDANQRVSVSHLLDLATLQWRRGANFQNPLHPAAAYDSVDDVMWYRAEATGALTKFDGTTVTTYTANNYAIDYNTVATVDTNRHTFVHWDGVSFRRLFVTSLSSPNTEPAAITLAAGPGGAPAFEYIAEIDKILAWSSGKTVYTLNPASYSAGWTAQGSGSSVTPPAPFNDCYGKYVWVPAVNCLIGISDVDKVAYAYRPVGT